MNPVRRIIVAGLVDSFGLSLGWTTFTLIAVARYDLATVGLFNAAMFTGMVVSAPATSWLAARVNGAVFLSVAGGVELVLRVASLCALLAGVSSSAVAALVLLMNVATWSGYAGMRAEIGALDPNSRSMTHYAVVITAVEAAGTSLAALLPLMHHGKVDTIVVASIVVLYGVALAPQFFVAAHSRVPSGRTAFATAIGGDTPAGAPHPARSPRVRASAVLLGGGAVMLLASGPATLSTALAAELQGQRGVVLSAVAVCLGSLAAAPIGGRLCARGLPAGVTWPLWGVAMLLGWVLASTGLLALLAAQALSSLAMTALQGDMDSVVASISPAGRTTSMLAWSTSMRAGASAVAGRAIPVVVAAPQIGWVAGPAAAVLAVSAVTLATRHRSRARLRPVGDALAARLIRT